MDVRVVTDTPWLARDIGYLVHQFTQDMAEPQVDSAATQTPAPADPAARRALRRQVLRTVHELFAAWTGSGQPWGILSGIRPVKLAHQLRRIGRGEGEIERIFREELRVDPDRAALVVEVMRRQLEVMPDLDELDREVSIYVGIPFCPTHCAYCTFPAYSMAEKHMYVDAFLAALAEEIRHAGRLLAEYGVSVTTVYIGGGTPTSLLSAELEVLLQTLTELLPGGGQWREFTVEAGRPDTITPDRLRVMRRFGVDRISVNPQTYNPLTLRAMRRGHTPEMVDHRFPHVRGAGFANINMDMILGLPGETEADMLHTLEKMMQLNPDSITVHTLAFKRSAALRDQREGLTLLPDAVLRRVMDEISQRLRAGGWQPYYLYRQKDILGNLENVGYAKPGKASPYNILMMEEAQLVIGIGGGAVTKLVGPGIHAGRFANPREPRAYIETLPDVLARKEKALRPVLEAIAKARRAAVHA
ncbi:MAG: coproporphyrinogen dehydrogenase HemZ [Thermoflavifilum sp.]|nr:coproporphyrinogen dehydrogenase HemZ [Thermoflavifilum sp.]MCL6514948.1 coproporphyrinogen dehydrogenase HemZ [Alicyclobacillus sp.]